MRIFSSTIEPGVSEINFFCYTLVEVYLKGGKESVINQRK